MQQKNANASFEYPDVIRLGIVLCKRSFVAVVSIETLDFYCCIHRNLRYRTSMLAQVLQIFLAKEHLVKNWLISTQDKVVY
jgi:hypothetical protein